MISFLYKGIEFYVIRLVVETLVFIIEVTVLFDERWRPSVTHDFSTSQRLLTLVQESSDQRNPDVRVLLRAHELQRKLDVFL